MTQGTLASRLYEVLADRKLLPVPPASVPAPEVDAAITELVQFHQISYADLRHSIERHLTDVQSVEDRVRDLAEAGRILHDISFILLKHAQPSESVEQEALDELADLVARVSRHINRLSPPADPPQLVM